MGRGKLHGVMYLELVWVCDAACRVVFIWELGSFSVVACGW